MDLTKPLAVHHIRKEDWIILRLLYLILSLDPTMTKVKDIQKTITYLNKKHNLVTGFGINYAFDLIKKEHGKLDTFNEIGIESIHKLQGTVNIHREYSSEEDKEFMQRRVFGLSKARYSSGVIQNIVDNININMGEKK